MWILVTVGQPQRQRRHRAGNLEKKTALCAEAEALNASTDWKATADIIRKLQKEWKTIGPVPKKYYIFRSLDFNRNIADVSCDIGEYLHRDCKPYNNGNHKCEYDSF